MIAGIRTRQYFQLRPLCGLADGSCYPTVRCSDWCAPRGVNVAGLRMRAVMAVDCHEGSADIGSGRR